MERTFAMIKPDATARGIAGKIVSRIEDEGFRILGMRLVQMTLAQAEGFYAVHRERPFFESLTASVSSGPIVVAVLEGYNAIELNRELMGATNPADAKEGTIRKDLAETLEANTVHGSDGPETAREEIAYFFSGRELLGVNRPK